MAKNIKPNIFSSPSPVGVDKHPPKRVTMAAGVVYDSNVAKVGNPYQYASVSAEDDWRLEVIFGREELKNALKLKGNSYLEATKFLFLKHGITLFLDQNKEILFSYSSNLFIEDFGKLTPISGFEAFNRYGLIKIEQAYDKGFTVL